MLRTTLLNGVTIERDTDYTAFANAVLRPWVVEGLKVVSGGVQAGIGFIKVTRTSTTPNEDIILKVELTATESLTTSGTKKVWIAINQINVNDPGYNVADGSGVATIETGASYPASNFIPLASISSGTITDERVPVTTVARDLNGNEYPIAVNTDGSLDMPFDITAQSGNFSWDIIGGGAIQARDPLRFERVSLLSSQDLDTLVTGGIYNSWNFSNKPSGALAWGYVEVFVHNSTAPSWGTTNTDYCMQRFTNLIGNSSTWVRIRDNGVWSTWEKIIVWGVPKLSDTPDKRGTTKTPIEFLNTLTLEFVNKSDLGITSTSNWFNLVTINSYLSVTSDNGIVHQYAYSSKNGEVYHRWSLNHTTWGGWVIDGISNINLPASNNLLFSVSGSGCGSTTEVNLGGSTTTTKPGIYRFIVWEGDANYVRVKINGTTKIDMSGGLLNTGYGMKWVAQGFNDGRWVVTVDLFLLKWDTVQCTYSPASSCGGIVASKVECRYANIT